MNIHSSIFRTGVLLVAVPLAFELVFVLTFYILVRDSQEQARQTAMILGNFQKVGVVTAEGYDFVLSSISYSTRPTTETWQEFKLARDMYVRDVAAMARVPQSDPLSESRVRTLSKGAALVVGLLDEMDAKIQSGNYSIPEGYRYSVRGRALNQNLKHELESFRLEYERRLNESVKEQEKFQQLLQIFLFGGISVSVLIATALCFFFSRSIVQRLEKVRDNTVRLATEEPLHQPITGTDEISELDKTLRKVAAVLAEVKRSERAVVENASDIICTIDYRGRFSSINPACKGIWGYDPTELLGRRCIDVLVNDGSSADTTVLSGTRGPLPADSRPFENRVKRKNGSYADMLWSVRKGEEDQSLFCVVHDITDRKEAERFKEQLTAMVSHDLRTPLTSIQWALSLLNVGALGELPPRALEKTQMAETEVVRLISLTNDLLEVESLTAGSLRMSLADTNLSDVLQSSLHAVETFADQHGVRVEVAETDLSVHTDGDRLSRVLINLLSNAIKFSPKGECVTVSVSKIPSANSSESASETASKTASETANATASKSASETANATASKSASETANATASAKATGAPSSIEISVKDRGRGIPDGYHEIIFERFRQVEESDSREKGGTGLGLAICKTIVEQLGGTIGVESKLGEGSNFWVRLPVEGSGGEAVPDDAEKSS